jgi:hypothetical protein
MSRSGRRLAKRLAKGEAALKRFPWSLPFFGLAAVIIFTDLSSDRAWPVAALLLAGIVVAAVPKATWKEMLASVENAQFGPIGVALRRDADKAAKFVPETDSREELEDEEIEEAKSMFDLRMRLEWKLAYVAKHLLADDDNATFLTIGSLNFDDYLSDAEARTATGILTTREEELQELSAPDREQFLKDAQKFLDGMRASIFWKMVRRKLKGLGRWKRDVPGDGDRNDLLAETNGGEKVRVVPVLSLDDKRAFDRAIGRLKDEGKPKRKLVVIPDHSEREEGEGPPQVVRLCNLAQALEREESAERAQAVSS